MPESEDKTPPEIDKKGSDWAEALSIVFLYSTAGMTAGMIGGLVVAVFADGPHDLPPKAATAGIGIGALAGIIRSRFK